MNRPNYNGKYDRDLVASGRCRFMWVGARHHTRVYDVAELESMRCRANKEIEARTTHHGTFGGTVIADDIQTGDRGGACTTT